MDTPIRHGSTLTRMAKPYVIALEEHYADPAVMARAGGAGPQGRLAGLQHKLNDLGDLRLQEMDAAAKMQATYRPPGS